ncbi:hypothetical protein C7S15_8984 (plasmid) [Burkholderia cepacia]|nr:hypothetical protein [Burkholderia cepacia]
MMGICKACSAGIERRARAVIAFVQALDTCMPPPLERP